MNINSPNLSTLLSGNLSSEDSNPLNADGRETGEFAQALMKEIGYLQNTAGQKQLPSPFQSLDELSEDSLQDIAALFGNKLPMAAKLDQGINLEKTLVMLKEVLLHIEEATRSDLPSLSEKKQLLDREEEDPLDIENVENLLLWLSINMDAEVSSDVSAFPNNSTHTRMIPWAIENTGDVALYQETGRVKAGGHDNMHDLLQTPVLTGKEDHSIAEGVASPIDVKVTEFPSEAMKKSDMFEQKWAEEWTDGKHLLELSAEIAPLSKRAGIEPKFEIPAMSRPIAHPEWNQELGERILWMNNKAMPFAELRLNPQHLGPVSIRINMDQEQANIAFSSQHASVREAIEAAVPKLREMLGAQQLHLGDVNVSQPLASDQGKYPGFGQTAQQQQDGGGQNKSDQAGGIDHGSHLADIAEEAEDLRAIVSKGLLSFFA